MKKYDYIFLDFDGPILDGRNRHYCCYKDILKKYGGNPIELNDYWEMKRNKVDRRTLLKLSNFQGSYDDYMREWLLRIEQTKYLQYDILQPNTFAAIEILNKQAEHLYLVTMRQSRENLDWQLQHLHIENLFEKVLCDMLDQKQTKYDLIKDISFRNALFIGDTEIDVNTAKKCKIEFRGVLNGLRNIQSFQDEKVYPDLYQLTKNL